MKIRIHDILVPMSNGIPDAVQVCLTEVDALGRQMPYVRISVNLKPAEKDAIAAIKQRAKSILERRTEAAQAAVAANPEAAISLDTPLVDEDAGA